MSEPWKCSKCGHMNTGRVGGMSFGGSFSSDMQRMRDAAENAQKVCASCGAERSSGCFIATAAYGSPLEPEILYLKKFRDQLLLKHRLGSAFVSVYELFSPPFARFIQRRTSLRFIVRNLFIGPIIQILKHTWRSK